MKETLHSHYRDRIIEEAAQWFARLHDGEASTEERARFADWLSASSEHVHEYLALTALHTDISELKTSQTAEDLVRLASAPQNGNVLGFKMPAVTSSGPRDHSEISRVGILRKRKYFALAASLALVTLGAVWGLQPDDNTALYTTAIGEQKSFTLPDSSVVTLNAVSKLQVRYTQQRRDIQLLSGEALFTVAKNPQRPFRVLTNDSVTQAVGTRFNVRHRQDNTTITVIEGRVKVSSSKLSAPAVRETTNAVSWVPVTAGQRAHLGAPGVIDVAAVDPTINIAWRDRRLVFESRPLSEVVAEFNLYNESPIDIRDPALNDVQVSGSFYANDPRSFVLFLEEAKLAHSQTRGGQILLLHSR